MLTRLLCRLGVHRWQHARTDEGTRYRTCGRCGKDGDYEGVGAALRAAQGLPPPTGGGGA